MTPRWRSKSIPELAPAPTLVEKCIAAITTAVLPFLLIRHALDASTFPGQPMGEGWGRVFAVEQVSRWWTGLASPTHADLIGFPEVVSFWPVDPLLTIPASLASLLIGPAQAITLTVFLLLWVAGWGPWRLARELGARPIPALIAGIVVQTQPFLLRNAEDTLMEMLAIGVAALAARGLVIAWSKTTAPNCLRAFGWALALGLCSPYLTVYLCLGWALIALTPAIRSQLKRYLTISAMLGLAAATAATPIAWLESGPHGRLQYEGGYGLHPDTLVLEVNNAPQVLRGAPRPAPLTALIHPNETRQASPKAPPSELQRALVRFPGGIACVFALIIGLMSNRGRSWGVLATAFFLLGPGPLLIARTLGLQDPSWMPLQAALSLFPMGASLGNPQRMVLAFGLIASIAGAMGSSERKLGVLIWFGVTILSVALTQPQLALPACTLKDTTSLLESSDGAVITFPSGDPPIWNPGVPAKYDLALSALHGKPVAYDYGRGRQRADAAFLYALSLKSQVAVGQSENAYNEADTPKMLETLREKGFHRVLVLDHLMHQDASKRAHRWLTRTLGPPMHQNHEHTVYAVPDAPLSP